MSKSYHLSTVVTITAVLVCLMTLTAAAQVSTPAPGKTVYLDSDGNEISNNEFVDIRMANFHYPDATIVKRSDDGTVEFRLQKIPQEGMDAPLISARTIDGKTIETSSLKGKVIVLNFWFIGCASCRAHQPKLNALKAKFAGREDVVFLAVTADPAGDVRRYVSKEKFSFIHIADAEELLKTFRFKGYPKHIVIDRQGTISYWRSTVHAWEKFESVIRSELAK